MLARSNSKGKDIFLASMLRKDSPLWWEAKVMRGSVHRVGRLLSNTLAEQKAEKVECWYPASFCILPPSIWPWTPSPCDHVAHIQGKSPLVTSLWKDCTDTQKCTSLVPGVFLNLI